MSFTKWPSLVHSGKSWETRWAKPNPPKIAVIGGTWYKWRVFLLVSFNNEVALGSVFFNYGIGGQASAKLLGEVWLLGIELNGMKGNIKSGQSLHRGSIGSRYLTFFKQYTRSRTLAYITCTKYTKHHSVIIYLLYQFICCSHSSFVFYFFNKKHCNIVYNPLRYTIPFNLPLIPCLSTH